MKGLKLSMEDKKDEKIKQDFKDKLKLKAFSYFDEI